MPSAPCQCPVSSCSAIVAHINYVGHMMTHKNELASFINNAKSADLFAEIKKDDVAYYCCFGCKKHYKDRIKMKDHMRCNPDCVTKHKEFLQSIGVNNMDKMTTEIEWYKKKCIELERENEMLKQRNEGLEDDSIFKTRIDALSKENYVANMQIQTLEEYLRIVPLYLRPEGIEYCLKFVKAIKDNEKAIIDGYTKQKQRRELIDLLQSTPLLQLYMLPQFSFLLNQHVPNGEYQTITGNYFTNFEYRAPTQPRGNLENIPTLPRLKFELSNDDIQKMAAANEPEQAKPVKQKRPAKQV